MSLESLLLLLGLTLIAVIANAMSAFAGGGAGLVQLPALILLGLPFATALATHKLAPAVWLGAPWAKKAPAEPPPKKSACGALKNTRACGAPPAK